MRIEHAWTEGVLRLSRDDYELLLFVMGTATGAAMRDPTIIIRPNRITALFNRLNQGNPNYRPYEVAEKAEKPA